MRFRDSRDSGQCSSPCSALQRSYERKKDNISLVVYANIVSLLLVRFRDWKADRPKMEPQPVIQEDLLNWWLLCGAVQRWSLVI